MPKPKYPLQPLLEHRDRKVDAATTELGAAVRSREAAERAAEEAAAAERAAAEAANLSRDSEAGRLAGGELRAADLAHGHAWELAEQQRKDELARATAAADEAKKDAATAETTARTAVATATADRDVVTKDRDRFDDRLRRAAEAAADEEAEDIHRGRSGKS